MKMKWHRIAEVKPDKHWNYHLWGSKIGLHEGYYGQDHWVINGELNLKDFSHFMPYPESPRKRSL